MNNAHLKKNLKYYILTFIILVVFFSSFSLYAPTLDAKDSEYQGYIDFFEEVYGTFEKNYYQPITREGFDKFINEFNTKIYGQLKGEEKSSDYIKWRSAAYLVDALKTSEDVFSAFFPPEPAQEYEEKVLGVRIDLGIEGTLVEQGYKTTQVEPRSDAYSKGLRIGDIIAEIDETDVTTLSKAQINELLVPLVDSKVVLKYLSATDNVSKQIEVVSQQYFKQSVFACDTKMAHIYCIDINRFNRKTAEDIFRFFDFSADKEK